MKNTVISRVKLLFAAALVASTLLFAGCDFAGSASNVYGTWTSAFGEVFTVSSKAFENSYHAEAAGVSIDYDTYKGSNVKVVSDGDDYGRIFFKYTSAYCTEHSTALSFVYDNDAEDVGKWYAVAYKDLTDTSIALSGAYKLTGKTSCDSFKEAEEEFTVDNGYFAYYSECTKKD